MSDEEPILEEGIEMPTRTSKRVEDKYKLNMLKKVGQCVFIPLGKHTQENIQVRARNLRQNINQHKRIIERDNRWALTVHWAERKGKPGFRVFLKEIKK